MKSALFWVSSIQYFIVQIIVANAWTTQFSLANNTISDLGNTSCAVYSVRYVCSSMHNLMNLSFVVLGLTMILGSIYISKAFSGDWSKVGFALMGLAGLGTIVVGLCPENSISTLHVLGATLPFLFGNIALIIFGLNLPITKYFRTYTLLSGVVALLALVLLLSENYFGLGLGGMERLVAYPQTIWMIVFGSYLFLGRFKRA